MILSLILLLMIPCINSNNIIGEFDLSNSLSMEQTTSLVNDTSWHHDCSNVSGWLIDPDPPQPRLPGIQDDVDILSDGSAIYSSSIPYAEGRWHGSVFFYELEKPVYVGYGLNFEVELNHPGTLNYAGGIEVGLYDQDKNVSYWVSITDSWYSSSFLTDVAYGDDGVNYVHTTSRSGSLQADFRVWHNETTNTIQGQDDQGTYTLANENQFEPNREIFYVGIMFWNVESYNYESNLVLDILIEGTSVEDTTPPTIQALPDYSYELGTTNHVLTWTAFDINPAFYTISRDDEILQFRPWNGSEIVINIDGLDLGRYLFTLNVSDTSHLFTLDMLNVSVIDTTPPQIDHPFDIIIEPSQENNSITWIPSDLKPSAYEIYENGTLVAFGRWNGSPIVYPFNGVVPGVHLYTIFVNDTSGNLVNDSVLVIVNPQGFPVDLTIIISLGSVGVIVIVVILILKTKSTSSGGGVADYQW